MKITDVSVTNVNNLNLHKIYAYLFKSFPLSQFIYFYFFLLKVASYTFFWQYCKDKQNY